MSSVESEKPERPYAGLTFDQRTIDSMLMPDWENIEDAEGDVRAAEEHMRADIKSAHEEFRAAQRRFEGEVESAKGGVAKAEEALEGRRQGVQVTLDGLELEGRQVDFAAGQSMAAIRFDRESGNYAEDAGYDLAGVSGTVLFAEAGALHDEPLERWDDVALVFSTEGGPELPAGRYAVAASQADFLIHEQQ